MITKDPYETLGVAKDATHEAIKKAYRALAFTLHPDRFTGSPEAVIQNENRFKEVAEAYSFLCDSEKKKKYDATGDIPDENVEFDLQASLIEYLVVNFSGALDLASQNFMARPLDDINFIITMTKYTEDQLTQNEKDLFKQQMLLTQLGKLRKIIVRKDRDKESKQDQQNLFVAELNKREKALKTQIQISENTIAVLRRALDELGMYTDYREFVETVRFWQVTPTIYFSGTGTSAT